MVIVFVPYRGIYFLYTNKLNSTFGMCVFSSPIGESTFSTERKQNVNLDRRPRFRPLSGNLLSLLDIVISIGESKFVFVPYRGIYFLYNEITAIMDSSGKVFSSPIGESTFSTPEMQRKERKLHEFSSPIGESTFSTVLTAIIVLLK